MLALLDQRDPFVPTDAESLIAKEAVEKLKPVVAAGVDVKIRVVSGRKLLFRCRRER